MKLFTAGFLGAALLSTTAMAQDPNWPNWYVGVHGEVSFVSDADVSVSGIANTGDASFDTGAGAGVALGFRPYGGGGLRTELEFSYRNSDIDQIGSATANGEFRTNAYMLNGYYDMMTGSAWSPYIGLGIGWANVDFDSTAALTNDSDSGIGYQGMLGVSFSPESMPYTEWGFGYRYFATEDLSYRRTDGRTLEHDYQSHNMEANARFRF